VSAPPAAAQQLASPCGRPPRRPAPTTPGPPPPAGDPLLRHSASLRVHRALLAQALHLAAGPRSVLDLLRARPTEAGVYTSSMMCIPRLTLLWLALQRLDWAARAWGSGGGAARREGQLGEPEDSWKVRPQARPSCGSRLQRRAGRAAAGLPLVLGRLRGGGRGGGRGGSLAGEAAAAGDRSPRRSTYVACQAAAAAAAGEVEGGGGSGPGAGPGP
jgi:hypothetical protein